MNIKKYQSIVEILLISIGAYSIHKLVFFLNDDNPKFQNFHFPIEFIYAFFCLCSIVILLILITVKSQNIDSVGSVFILATCIKIAVSYAVLSPILHSGNLNMKVERIDFFIIFILFLTIETVVTIRILNKKQ